jgi:hypothetical protein
MRVQPPALAPVAAVQPAAAATPLPETKSAVAGPAPLTGVRRKTDPAPTILKPPVSFTLAAPKATPTPTPTN